MIEKERKRVVSKMSEGAIVTYHDINRIYEIIDSQETRLRMVEEGRIKSDGIIEKCVESNDKLSNMIEKFNLAIVDVQLTFKDVHNENKNNRQYIKSVDEKVDEKFSEINYKVDEVSKEFHEDKDKNMIDTRVVQKEIQTNWLKENWGKVAGTGGFFAICGLLVKLIEALSKLSK